MIIFYDDLIKYLGSLIVTFVFLTCDFSYNKMALNIKLDAFLNTKPQPEWLNQLRVTIAMGKKFEQKGDFEKAAKGYETVLYYDPEDTRTRVKLSKCYQKILQPEQAVKHQTHAMQNDPNLLQTTENEASVNFELGNFESSLMTYSQYFKRRKTSFDCNQGLLKVYELIYILKS